MGLTDLLILFLAAHQGMDVHLPEFASAPEKGQQVASAIAGGRGDKASSAPFQPGTVFHHDHAVQDCQQDLLQQHAQSQASGKGGGSQQQALPHVQAGDLLLLHADQQIDAELPAPFLQDETDHVVDQPRHDQDHEEGGQAHQDREDDGHLEQLLYLLGEEQGMEGEHDGRHHRHGQEIHQIIPGGAHHVAQGKLTEHRTVHLLSGTERPVFRSKIHGGFSSPGAARGRSARPLRTESSRSSWRRRHRVSP